MYSAFSRHLPTGTQVMSAMAAPTATATATAKVAAGTHFAQVSPSDPPVSLEETQRVMGFACDLSMKISRMPSFCHGFYGPQTPCNARKVVDYTNSIVDDMCAFGPAVDLDSQTPLLKPDAHANSIIYDNEHCTVFVDGAHVIKRFAHRPIEECLEQALKECIFSSLISDKEDYIVLTHHIRLRDMKPCHYSRVGYSAQLEFTMKRFDQDLYSVLFKRPAQIHRPSLVTRFQWVLECINIFELYSLHGIIPGDPKPANIVLDADGHLRMIDHEDNHFGKTWPKNFRAWFTVTYRPIECFPQKSDTKATMLGESSVVWVLGAIIYEIITEKPLVKLYPGASQKEWDQNVQQELFETFGQDAATGAADSKDQKTRSKFDAFRDIAGEGLAQLLMQMLQYEASRRITLAEVFNHPMLKSMAARTNLGDPKGPSQKTKTISIFGNAEQAKTETDSKSASK